MLLLWKEAAASAAELGTLNSQKREFHFTFNVLLMLDQEFGRLEAHCDKDHAKG